MPKVTIDGEVVEVPEGINLIQAAKSVGKEIPHYCYHERLTVAGNCRICLVEIEKQPKLQIACNTPVQEGMVVWTRSPRVLEGRQAVMEFILINHPIDCPVCDQAGECKLQQYYMKHDLQPSRMDEPKVQKEKAVPLGPNVMLDMERCILCSRCIRFCKEIARSDELCFTERGDHTELTTYPGKTLENPYSLNTVDICPVGALTSRDFRFQQRVWFLKKTPSICPGCATGCNIEIDHNQGKIYRLLPRENDDVNQCWMCDEGRTTYKPVNDPGRLRTPLWCQDGELRPVRRSEAVRRVAEVLRGVEGSQIVGIGSAQFSNEDNRALVDFLKGLGATDFYYQAQEVANPSQDDFLVSADKNPNRAGVEALGMKRMAPDRRYQVFLVLGTLPEERLATMALEKGRVVLFFATHETPDLAAADFVLPAALWAEQDGTFTNKTGRVQKFQKAFDPPGEAGTVAELLEELTGHLEGEGIGARRAG